MLGAAALALVSPGASAAGPAPSPRAICTTAADGTISCIDVVCIPPLLWNGTACVPLSPPPPPVMCEVRLLYTRDNPSGAFVTGTSAWCDDAGADLAIAVILAKRLGDNRP